jgi:hypothetical protein
MAKFKAKIELDNAHVLAVGISLAAPNVASVTRRTMNRAEVLSPVRTGNMRASHSMTMRVRRTSVTGRVEVAAKYAEFVHGGTKAHNITANRVNALAFRWERMGGVQTFVPKKGLAKGPTGLRKSKKKGVHFYIAKGFVRHPGTKARPWLFKALKEVATLENYEVSGLSLSAALHGDFGL